MPSLAQQYDVVPSRIIESGDDVDVDDTIQCTPGDGDETFDRLDSDTRLDLEPGEYPVSQEHSPEDNAVISGSKDENGEPTTRITHKDEGGLFVFKGDCGDFVIENVVFDQTFDWDTSLGVLIRSSGDLLLKNVRFAGANPMEPIAVDNMAPQATTEDGTVLLDNVRRVGPTHITSHGSQGDGANEGCIWLGENHKGDLFIHGSEFRNTGTNSIYASRTRGSIHVLNTHFENNNQACLRTGGGQRTNTIKDCTFVIDTDNAHPKNRYELDGYINPTGPIVETRNTKPGVETQKLVIEDSDFLLLSGPPRSRLCFVDGQVGPVEVDNCRFRSEKSHCPAFIARTEPRWDNAADDQSISFNNVSVSGDGEVRVDGGRPATMSGGCCSVSTSGIEHENVSDAECAQPVIERHAHEDVDTQVLVVEGTGVKTDYIINTTGSVFRKTNVEDWDSINGGTIDGWITDDGDVDEYEITGDVQSVDFREGDATVTLDGEVIESGSPAEEEPEEPEEPDNSGEEVVETDPTDDSDSSDESGETSGRSIEVDMASDSETIIIEVRDSEGNVVDSIEIELSADMQLSVSTSSS